MNAAQGDLGSTPKISADEAIRVLTQAASKYLPKYHAPEGSVPREPEPTPDQGSVEDLRLRILVVLQNKAFGTTERQREVGNTVVNWLHVRGEFYFHAERRDFSSGLYFDATRKLLLRVQSDDFLGWLADCMATNRAERVFAFVQSACETESLGDSSTGIQPEAFWAAREGVIYLSNGPGAAVRITAEKAELVDNGVDDVLFPYGSTLEPWKFPALPVDPFEACALFRDMQTSAPHGLYLFKLWLCSLASNQPTKPALVLAGEIGSGKTRLARGAFELYGLPHRINSATENGVGDFWSGIDAGGILVLDNADTKISWLPDAVAGACTGQGYLKRKLYTDSDNVYLRSRAWQCLTSASPTFASDPGLADRLIVVRLNRRTGETSESVLGDEIRANRNGCLCWIVEKLRRALADTAPVPGGLNSRHPDFAHLAVRIGRAIESANWNPGIDARTPEQLQAPAVLAMQSAELDKAIFNVENDWVGAALLELLQAGPFNGTAAELHKKLEEVDSSITAKMSAKSLSKRLSKLWPHLQSACKAESEKAHGGIKRFSFQKPYGGIGGFETGFSVKSLGETNNRTLSEKPIESHQTHPNAPDFGRQGVFAST